MTIDIRYIFEKSIDNPSLKLIISAIRTIITFLTGGFGTILRSFVVLLFLDLLTDVLGFPWPLFLKEKLLQTKEKKFGGVK